MNLLIYNLNYNSKIKFYIILYLYIKYKWSNIEKYNIKINIIFS